MRIALSNWRAHNRRLLRVNNQYRFMTIYRETKQRLERNEFGRLFHVQCWQQMFHPPASEPNWRRELLQYTLFEFATHALDLIAYFYGDTPEAVNIFTPACRPEFAADVVVAGVLRFPGRAHRSAELQPGDAGAGEVSGDAPGLRAFFAAGSLWEEWRGYRWNGRGARGGRCGREGCCEAVRRGKNQEGGRVSMQVETARIRRRDGGTPAVVLARDARAGALPR